MKEEKNEETFFSELMSKSKLAFPFPDFEDNVMLIVESSQKKRNISKGDLRLSWIFFLLGSFFGIAISILLPKFQEPVLGLSIEKFILPFQILFIFLLITQLNSLIDYYRKTKISKR